MGAVGLMLPAPAETARIVVCEDDQPTLELLCDHLTADRFGVLPAPTAADAIRLCTFNDPDLLLLDLGLPDATGLDLLREIRNPDRSTNRVDPSLGVIIVSGRSTERDRVRGLGEGADDYVQKPFSYGELLARINSVLRRRRRNHSVLQVGDIEINDVEHTVKVSGRYVRLSMKEYALLKVMANEPSRVFSKEELLREVWGYRSMGHTRTLEAHCSRLRKKLDPKTGRFIVNCWGVGLVLRQTWFFLISVVRVPIVHRHAVRQKWWLRRGSSVARGLSVLEGHRCAAPTTFYAPKGRLDFAN